MKKNQILGMVLLLTMSLFSACNKNEPTPTPDPEIEVPTPDPIKEDPVITIEDIDSEFFLPFLRWWDNVEDLKAFEENRGNQLSFEQADQSGSTYLLYSTDSQDFPSIIYLHGSGQAVVQADNSDPERTKQLLSSNEFNAFLKHYGFEPEGDPVDGYQMYKSTKYTTVNLVVYLTQIVISEDYILEPGIYCTSIDPKLNEIPFPLLDWNATPEMVAKYEGLRNFEAKEAVNIKDNVVGYPFSYKRELLGYTKLYAPRYEFKDGKLARITLWITPHEYVFKRFGDGVWETYQDFNDMAEAAGYKRTKSSDPEVKVDVYVKEGGNNKFTLEMYNLNVNGKKMVAAALAFVPAEGPDVVEW